MAAIRVLLWLKLMLTWRGYRKNKMKALSAILMLLAFGPISALVAFGIHALLANAHPWEALIIARDVFFFIYILWTLTPLVGFQLNESYDLTKLFSYPVPYPIIFLGSVLGGFLDLPVVLTLPTIGVLIAHFSHSPITLLVNIVLALIFMLHTLALGQALILTQVGFLRSRRFRDISIVLFPLIGMAYSLGQQTFLRQISSFHDRRLLDAPIWHLADWLPPGYITIAYVAIGHGEWVAPLLGGIALASAGVLSLWVAATSLRSLYFGDVGPKMPRPAATTAHKTITAFDIPSRLLAMLPRDIRAVASKEFLYFEREPQYKMMAVQIVCALLVVAIPIMMPTTHSPHALGGVASLGSILFFGVSAMLFFSLMPLVFNIFGGEGSAITVLFSLPTSRRAIIMGKNVAHLTLMLGLNAFGLTILAAISNNWNQLPLVLAWVLMSAPVLLATGNLISIRFPHRMVLRGQHAQKAGLTSANGDGAGCIYGAIYLLAYMATFIALIPGMAAIALPRIYHMPWAYAFTLPLGFAYAAILYRLLLVPAEKWLMEREPELSSQIIPAD